MKYNSNNKEAIEKRKLDMQYYKKWRNKILHNSKKISKTLKDILFTAKTFEEADAMIRYYVAETEDNSISKEYWTIFD